MPLPTWDVFIGLAFLVGIAYGFILRRDKTITTLCSVYMGLVISQNFSKTIFDFFNGNTFIANQLWIRSNAPISTITIVLFLASILAITWAINSSNRTEGDISPLEVIIYSGLAIALIIASVLGFLPEASRNHILEISKIAKIIFQYKTAWIIIPPISLIVLNLKKSR
jgi:putative Ca2+/H+ antiporter (TMEM165/GDT1 family)